MKKRKKRYLNSLFIWLILVVTCISFFVAFVRIPLFPIKWTIILGLFLLIILCFTGVISSRYRKGVLIKTVDILLSIILGLGSIALPYYQSKISKIMDGLANNKEKIGFYVINDTYRSEHQDLFDSLKSENIEDYSSATFITSFKSDNETMEYAESSLKEVLKVNQISINDKDSVNAAAEELYQNKGDVLILSDSFVSALTESEEYSNFLNDTKMIYSIHRPINSDSIVKSTDEMTTTPFSIFIAGNDEEGELKTVGKTDVNIIVTVNPNSHQISIVSIPRDAYIPNLYYEYPNYDKLTHLGIFGIQNTLDGLNNYFQTNIENFVIVNFTTFRQILTSVGGVDIENDIEFVADDGEYFPAGPIHITGDQALMYVREREVFINGDMERNYHQQLVLEALVKKMTSPEIILHFNDLLSALENQMLTNVSTESIYALCQKQLNQNIEWNIVKYGVLGEPDYDYCVTMPDTLLSIVRPYDNQVKFVSKVMNSIINGDIVVQEELPSGSFDEYPAN